MGRAKRSRFIDPVEKDDSKKSRVDIPFENRLGESFFESHSTIDLATALIGKYLCRIIDDSRPIIRGRIVETEAYLGAEDHASYSYGGRRTEGNEPMYMEAGTCFVRFTYGMYHCFNLSSRDPGGAVLIRAIEPVDGIEQMIELRNQHPKAPKTEQFAKKQYQIANGPSKLCIAYDIDRRLNKTDIRTSPIIWLEDNLTQVSTGDIIKAPRIGISAKNPWASKLLRFYLRDNRSVSKFV